jgi:ceramide glucosyltransferase
MIITLWVAWVIFAASVGYMLVASFCLLKFKAKLSCFSRPQSERLGVSLYKPLYGLDYGLKQNLLSFCRQDYPNFQVIFGVSDANDPAVSIVREVISACPDVDIELVINSWSNGENPKVSNLINMDEVAKHDVLVISDSDMRVEPDYIDRIVAAFEPENVGLVTCLYKGTPAPGLASKLGAMFINQWFVPSTLIPATFGGQQHCFGATMAIQRGVLNQIGGLKALVGNLADDYTLGRLVREAGFEVRLANVVIENIVEETSLSGLILHELRWARTIRSVEPLGFISTFITDTLPLGLALSLVSYLTNADGVWTVAPLVLAIIARFLLHISTKTTFSSKHADPFWIIPIRDMLSLLVRILCFAGKTVNWRNSELSVNKGGQIHKPATGNRQNDDIKENTVSESSLL